MSGIFDESGQVEGAGEISLPETAYANAGVDLGAGTGELDEDWFKLDLAPGVHTLAVLGDYFKAVMYDEDGAVITGLLPESQVAGAELVEKVIDKNGHTTYQVVDDFSLLNDTLAAQQYGLFSVEDFTYELIFFQLTATLKNSRVVSDYTYTGEYYLHVSVLDTGLLGVFNGQANGPPRYLITEGNPTGQRSDAWGGWVQTIFMRDNADVGFDPFQQPDYGDERDTVKNLPVVTSTASTTGATVTARGLTHDEATGDFTYIDLDGARVAIDRFHDDYRAFAEKLDDLLVDIGIQAGSIAVQATSPSDVAPIVASAVSSLWGAYQNYKSLKTLMTDNLDILRQALDQVTIGGNAATGRDYDGEAIANIQKYIVDGGIGQGGPIGSIINFTEMFTRRGETGGGLRNQAPETSNAPLGFLALPAQQSQLLITASYVTSGDTAFTELGDGYQDVFTGDAYADRLGFGDGDDAAYGAGGDDELGGGEGRDALLGGDGADILRGGGGTDLLQGGAGDDALDGGAAGDQVSGGGGADVITGGGGGDTLTGGAGADVFKYLAAADSRPDAYDIVTDFTTGSDVLDLKGVTPSEVSLVRSGGTTFVFVNTPGGAMTIAATGEVNGLDVLTHDGHGVYMIGDGAANTLVGGATGDVIQAGDGDDVIIGGAGGDVLFGQAGADVFKYLAASDSNAAGSDGLYGFETGIDKVDLTAVGPTEISLIRGGGSTFLFAATPGGAMQLATVGADLNAGDLVTGLSRGIFMIGDETANSLTGAGLNDVIQAGAGADTVRGGGGGDALWGGAGADVFKYGAASDSGPAASDSIFDFQAGVDKLDLTGARAGAGDVYGVLASGGSTFVFVDLGGDGTNDMTLQLTGTAALQAGDILF